MTSLLTTPHPLSRARTTTLREWAGGPGVSRTRGYCTWALGGLWVLDGVLQLQPSMFTNDFPQQILRPAGQGSPSWVAEPVAWSAALVTHHLVVLNLLFALIQLLLGAGILLRRTRKAALAASIAWALMVWWLGEGLGTMLAGPVSVLMGLPGAVVLYALVAGLVWPRADRARGRCVAYASPLGSLGSRVLWCGLWGLCAVETLMPPNSTQSGLHDMVAGMATGEPGWVQFLDRLGADALDGRGTAASVVLAVLCAVVAAGVLAPAPIAKAAVVVAVALSVLVWIFGEDFGGLATGHATDPNTGPLLALLAWCYWPHRHDDQTNPD